MVLICDNFDLGLLNVDIGLVRLLMEASEGRSVRRLTSGRGVSHFLSLSLSVA